MNFVPRPAPLSKRVLAGAIDSAAIGVLCFLSFAVPMLTRGIVIPMWGVLAVMVGYAVVPLAFLKRTLGLQLMGLELVGKTGHAVDLANLLFRELLGRGFFPAAYLLTIFGGVVASMLGVGANVAPAGIAGLMTLACAGALSVAAIGHLIGISRDDQRTLADLISGSFVVQAPALPLPTDADELAEVTAQRRTVLIRIIVFELALMASVLALPWVLTRSSGESPQMKIARLKRESLQSKFDANPGVESIAAELQREYLRAGMKDEAKKVWDDFVRARSLREVGREEALRKQFDERKDRPSAEALIQLLDEQDRIDEAAEVYRAFLGDAPTPSLLVGFGNWLATNNKTDEAAAALERAVAADPLVPLGHTLLGVCYARLGRDAQAREQLTLALLDDPEDEDAADALKGVEAKVGVLPASERKTLQKRVEAWRSDGGVPPSSGGRAR